MNPYNDSLLYFNFRPAPPKAVVEEIKQLLNGKLATPFELAVDVGCGSGQMTNQLAPYFTRVIGLDINESQIDEAKRQNECPNVTFRLGSADHTDLGDNTVDLIIACEAVHWFDILSFHSEVDRVLKPNGVLALIGYMYPEPILEPHSENLLGLIKKWFVEYRHLWPKQHDLLFNRYQDVPHLYSFQKRVDPIPNDTPATLAHVMGHLRSRSGIQALYKQNPKAAFEILKSLQTELLKVIGASDNVSPEDIKLILRFNYFLVMSQKPVIKN